MYVTTLADVVQVDTHHPDLARADPAAAVTALAPASAVTADNRYYEIERGPDCRLYVGWPGSARRLSVVDEPSRAGQAAALHAGGVLLPTKYFVALPNFPPYHLWARDRVAMGLAPLIDTAVCDSAIRAHAYTGVVGAEEAAGAVDDDEPRWRLASAHPVPRAAPGVPLWLPPALARAPAVAYAWHGPDGRRVGGGVLAGVGARRTAPAPAGGWGAGGAYALRLYGGARADARLAVGARVVVVR